VISKLLRLSGAVKQPVPPAAPAAQDDDPKRSLEELREQVDTLYRFVYDLAHDLESPLTFGSRQTREAFSFQWQTYSQGQYLLSDPWFKENVTRILCEEELLLRPEWFRGKRVLDAGCGNGRWSYGLARLGCALTSVDVNEGAIEETRAALWELKVPKAFHVSPVERLTEVLPEKSYDLVFCWGVLHHCENFNEGLRQLARLVKDDGILYLYLYGRESMPYEGDVNLFKQRLRYNTLPSPEARYRFLLDMAKGDETGVHNQHDIYAPLINRRLEFGPLKEHLERLGFMDVRRTIAHTELFVRALKGSPSQYEPWLLPPKKAPYWFQHHALEAAAAANAENAAAA
jgi:2-polyprenyl-3-methyl-5-hydroxy-6-metoxy-1,4-benzoquinol methylase